MSLYNTVLKSVLAVIISVAFITPAFATDGDGVAKLELHISQPVHTNTNYAIPAGLSPTKDAIFLEDKNSPYANIIVVRSDELHDKKIQNLVRAFQSPEVAAEANKLFNGQAIPAW